ncbi:MAG TPA: SPFH domain-containing protein [Streptosporangiaceae bacterium]|nr:SPFH domain-containing protein [Streptosporangiaceae bacterium]
MSVDTGAGAVTPGPSGPEIRERAAAAAPGRPVLAGVVVAAVAGIVLLGEGSVHSAKGLIFLGALLLVAAVVASRGLTSVAPGEARVVQVFGRYAGTIRADGLAWVNLVADKRKVSTRIRNHETTQAKVNDADGNPIEIAAVVVWQVADTASALYSVDDYTQFVTIQTETAVRHIASSYPYTSRREGELSLRDNAEEITSRLSAEIAARVALAGVHIIESRLTRLSYAPEIAQAMLRQQQANAVVGARQRIVEGAVGMVQLALQRLQDEDVVELDEERKATMVSNLLVVLCSEQATQPVVNTGTLYQ